MQVWPDDVDTPAVKGSRHLEGPSGWLECWGGRSCSEDRSDALGLGFSDVEWGEGQVGHSRGEVCEKRPACREDWEGQLWQQEKC